MRVWDSIRAFLLRLWLRDERRYARRWILRLKLGRRHSTLGNDVKDEAETRRKAEQWLAYMRGLGLKPNHACVEIGCGSLWAAEPVIRYLDPGKYVGLDITDYFFSLGRRRLGTLIDKKRVELRVLTPEELTRQADRPADFVFARKVLAHVEPDELPEFMANFCRLIHSGTIGVIDNPKTETTGYRNPGTIAYALADILPHVPPGIKCTQHRFTLILCREMAPVMNPDDAARAFA